MVDSIGSGSELARAAVEAARRSHAQIAEQLTSEVAPDASSNSGALVAPTEGTKPPFANALVDGLREMDAGVKAADQLPYQMITGEVRDFHEVALRLKQSELSFKFALEVRNKLIDAYREVMRMGV